MNRVVVLTLTALIALCCSEAETSRRQTQHPPCEPTLEISESLYSRKNLPEIAICRPSEDRIFILLDANARCFSESIVLLEVRAKVGTVHGDLELPQLAVGMHWLVDDRYIVEELPVTVFSTVSQLEGQTIAIEATATSIDGLHAATSLTSILRCHEGCSNGSVTECCCTLL